MKNVILVEKVFEIFLVVLTWDVAKPCKITFSHNVTRKINVIELFK